MEYWILLDFIFRRIYAASLHDAKNSTFCSISLYHLMELVCPILFQINPLENVSECSYLQVLAKRAFPSVNLICTNDRKTQLHRPHLAEFPASCELATGFFSFLFVTQSVNRLELCCFSRWIDAKHNAHNRGSQESVENR